LLTHNLIREVPRLQIIEVLTEELDRACLMVHHVWPIRVNYRKDTTVIGYDPLARSALPRTSHFALGVPAVVQTWLYSSKIARFSSSRGWITACISARDAWAQRQIPWRVGHMVLPPGRDTMVREILFCLVDNCVTHGAESYQVLECTPLRIRELLSCAGHQHLPRQCGHFGDVN
jgi:hypothetical protein